jgi:hypothetical protein
MRPETRARSEDDRRHPLRRLGSHGQTGVNSGPPCLRRRATWTRDLLSLEELTSIRATYRPGARVRLLSLGQPDRRQLKPGTLGTIRSVDDLGTVHVEWDNGLRLGCIVIGVGPERADDLQIVDAA